MQKSELTQRLLVAGVGIPVIFGLIYKGHWFFLGFCMFVVLLAVREFYALAAAKGSHPQLVSGMAFALLTGLFLFKHWPLMPLLFGAVVLISFIEVFRGREHGLYNVSVTVGGFLYLSLFYALMLIRQMPLSLGWDYSAGAWIIALLLVSIWICDTAAYGFGSWLGKHALLKRVSPNKSWEGAIFGFLFAIISAWCIQHFFIPELRWFDGIVLGVFVGIGGQLGDLVESLYKRDAGVKDSSALLPGHGGALDRFDSPLMVAPMAYIYLLLVF